MQYAKYPITGGGGGGSVTSVTASSPLSSSGGATPNISFTGTLSIANGGTGQTSAPSALAALGGANVNLSNLVNPTAINQNLLFGTDNTNDIGGPYPTAAGRPRVIWGATAVVGGAAGTTFLADQTVQIGLPTSGAFRSLSSSGTQLTFFRASAPAATIEYENISDLGTIAVQGATAGFLTANYQIPVNTQAHNTIAIGCSQDLSSGFSMLGAGHWALVSAGVTRLEGTTSAITAHLPITVSTVTGSDQQIIFGADANVISNPTLASIYIGSFPASLTGQFNQALGFGALQSATSGTNNIGIGYSAGLSLTSSINNIFIGRQAGLSIAGGQQGNVFIGTLAGQSSIGSNNTFIGNQAGSTSTSAMNNIVIGAGADLSSVTAQNELQIGSASSFIQQAYIGSGTTTASLQQVTLNATGAQGTDTSAAVSTFNIAGARGTGTGTGGSVVIKTAPAGSTGSSLNTLVETFRVDPNSVITLGQAAATPQHVLNTSSTTGAQLGTLTNVPVAGNPAGYIQITINGSTRYIPFW